MLSECEAIFRKWAEEERGGVESQLPTTEIDFSRGL